MTSTTRLTRSLAAVLVGAVVAACGSPSGSGTTHATVSAITIATTLDIPNLDAIVSNSVESSHAINDPLVRIAADGSLAPGIASKWTSNSDATQWTFSIRSGAKFSDGSPITADDAVWTYTTILGNDKSLNRPNISPYIASVSKVSDTEVQFVLKAPFAAWPRQTSLITIVPQKAYQALGPTVFQSKPVGSGAYTPTSFTPSQQVVFEVNKSYWGGTSPIAKATEQYIANETTRLQALQSRTIDVAVLSPATADTARADRGLTVKSVPSNIVSYLGFNVNAPVLNNLKLRQAMDHAIDRQAIAKTIYKGAATPIGQLWSQATFGYDPSFKPTGYDVNKAKQLVQESGYSGQPIPFTYPNGPAVPQAAELSQAIGGYLKAVGINTDLRVEDQTTFIGDWTGRRFPGMYLFTYQPSTLDANIVVGRLMVSTSAGYAKDPTLEGLVIKQAGQADPKARQATISQITKLSNDNAYYLPLLNSQRVYAWVSDRVKPTMRADGYLFPQDMNQP
jgi:peptide/nickel transport system substrate-binding protein